MIEGDAKLRKVERLLDRIVQSDPRHSEIVEEIKGLLQSAVPVAAAIQRRTGASTRYQVTGKGREGVLAEMRPSTPPLKVPRRHYDAIVAVLKDADRPLGFDEIQTAMSRLHDDSAAEWQSRTVLRFMLSQKVVLRSRSRYAPLEKDRFVAAADKAWKSAMYRTNGK